MPSQGEAGNAARADKRAFGSREGRIIGLALLALVLVVPAPAGMSPPAWRTAGVGLLMATWWMTEAIPIPATALAPLLLFPLLGILPIREAAAPYADPVIFLFLGGFLLAAAIQRCGLHVRIALTIVQIGGVNPAYIVGAFMAATALISMWVSNTATAAMMLPIALSVLTLAQGDARHASTADPHFPIALLLGVAYSASIGGLGTLIGTPPNALLAGLMAEVYGTHIGFLEWALLAMPLVLVALPVTWFVLTRVLYPLGTDPLAGGRKAIAGMLDALGRPSRAELLVGSVVVLTAILWVFRPLLDGFIPELSDAGIAMGGALLLFLLPTHRGRNERALDWADAERLPWGVLVLFGGGLSLASAIQEIGLASWIGQVLAGISTLSPVLVIAAVTTIVVFLTELTSNTATAAVLLPVVAALAGAVGLDPRLLMVPTALAASCAFMMPVATPPNAIVYGSGQLTIRQMMRAGFVLNLLFIGLITVAALLWVPIALGVG